MSEQLSRARWIDRATARGNGATAVGRANRVMYAQLSRVRLIERGQSDGESDRAKARANGTTAQVTVQLYSSTTKQQYCVQYNRYTTINNTSTS